MLYIGGEGGAGGDSVFDLALRSYRFDSITMPGQRTEGRTPIRIETTFHELHGSFQIFTPSSDLGFLSVCIRKRERQADLERESIM